MLLEVSARPALCLLQEVLSHQCVCCALHLIQECFYGHPYVIPTELCYEEDGIHHFPLCGKMEAPTLNDLARNILGQVFCLLKVCSFL